MVSVSAAPREHQRPAAREAFRKLGALAVRMAVVRMEGEGHDNEDLDLEEQQSGSSEEDTEALLRAARVS